VHYRIYSLNPLTGRIVHATDLIADDDLEAVRHGRAQHDGRPFEIWCAERRVHSSPIDGTAAARDGP
jgi:hypothetical protein